MLVSLRSVGTVRKPKLEVTVESKSKISKKEDKEITSKVSHIFGLEQDLEGFYSFAEKDPVLRRAVRDFHGLRGYSEPAVFETIVIAILEQQVTLNYARKMRELLIKKFGDKLEVNDQVYYAFPSPEALGKASIEELKKCGLSGYKASYIKEISKSIFKGEFNPEKLRQLSTRKAMESLMKLKGIGRWTAEYILARGLGRNVIPADDVALRKATSEFYFSGKELSGEEIREFAQKWDKYRGLSAFYLLYARRHRKRQPR